MSPQNFLPLLNAYLEKWAQHRPNKVALIQYEDGREISYQEFLKSVDEYAQALLALGISKGDRVAAMLGLSADLIFLMYACFKMGAIIATLDVRLKDQEVVSDLKKIDPVAFFFVGNNPVRDFREVARVVKDGCPSVRHLVEMPLEENSPEPPAGFLSRARFLNRVRLADPDQKQILRLQLDAVYASLGPRTPALIIYTTGTTGAPKPAVLCHENIIVQNEIFARGITLGENSRILVNLPPSHVGCVTACASTMFYLGGTAVIQRCFDPQSTLDAVQKYRINIMAEIPTQYRMLWAYPGYEKYDLSSLDLAIYGGSSADASFLKKLASMAPRFATGIGMTETAGFCTFTPSGISIEEMAGQVGRAFEDLAPVTVRKPMNPDGTAGAELPDGEVGEICHHPPLVFLGYFNQPEETAKAISKEGILYSGDLGYTRSMGTYRAVYLSGRRKFVIKQSGYNVFPDEVEAHISSLEGVDQVSVVGVEHELLGEGIYAFVRLKNGAGPTPEEVMKHCKKIAAYKRPHHVEIWPADQSFPINRTSKVDKVEMTRLAQQSVMKLRQEGQWDSQKHAQFMPVST